MQLKLAAVLVCAGPLLVALPAGGQQKKPAPRDASFKFRIQALVFDYNEACDVADFNRDGHLDISAGEFWFPGPKFDDKRPLRIVGSFAPEYRENNGEHAFDVDGDGWMDVVSGSFQPTEVFWYRNPGKEGLESGSLWEKRSLIDTRFKCNEASLFHDLDGDGQPEFVVNSWQDDNPLMAWRFGKDAGGQPALLPITIGAAAPQSNGHGQGFGDINGDGREDIIFKNGWYERPEQDAMTQAWKVHNDWEFPHACVPMLVSDVDADGRNDVLWADGHGYGIFWEQQKAPGPDGSTNWRHITIDRQYSQLHTMTWADLDNDGNREVVTGRRLRAHCGKDPGDNEPPVVLAYARDANSKAFKRHVLAEGAGCGLVIRIADLNKDGQTEIVSASKAGTFILWNECRGNQR
jgi:hypothetical protein